MPFDAQHKVWMDGALKPYAEAGLGPASHGLHYGTGVFEGIRCYETAEGPAVFRLQPHWDRFFGSAAAYGIPVGHTREELTRGLRELLAANRLRSCYIRPIVFLGDETLGVHATPKSHVAMLAWPWKAPHGKKAAEAGVRVTVSSWLKFHRGMMPTTAKACGQYVNSILAVREAALRGFDEALMLNADGTVAEGAVENVFLVKDGVLVTNGEESNILPGITRASVLELAGDLGIPARVRPFQALELRSADEAFFTGTAVEVSPIREIDGSPVGSGSMGPITARLKQAFLETATGKNPGRRSWLTFLDGAGEKA